MDKLVSGMQHKFRKMHDKKGMTMFSLFLIIVVIIFLTIIFSNPDFIRKINRGRVTTAWSNELSSLSNGVLSLNNNVNVLYPTRLKGADGLDIVIPAPPLSAYESVQQYDIMTLGGKSIKLDFDHKSTVTATVGSSGTGVTSISSPSKGTVTGNTIDLSGLSKLGSKGITTFVNKSIPNIEESLFLGLLNQDNSDLGTKFSEKGTLDLTVKGGTTNTLLKCHFVKWNTAGNLECGDGAGTTFDTINNKSVLETFISMVFGSGAHKDLQSPKLTSWISIKPVDSAALQKAVGGNYRFYNTDDFNVFWVDSVAPKADAITIFEHYFTLTAQQKKDYTPNASCAGGDADCTEAIRELAGKIYDKMLAYVQPDAMIIMPTTKSGAVYSSNSDFRLYKFSTTD